MDNVGGYRYLYRADRYVVEGLLPTIALNTNSAAASSGGGYVIVFPPATGTTNAVVIGNTNTLQSVAVRGGIDQLRFTRVNFDSLIESIFNPVTNLYTDVFITNSVLTSQSVERVIATPDIVFGAQDLGVNVDGEPVTLLRTDTTGWTSFDAQNGIIAEPGPGIITPGIQILFSDMFPFFLNETPANLSENTYAAGNYVWASFDGSTNAPIVYPEYLHYSLKDMQNINTGGNIP